MNRLERGAKAAFSAFIADLIIDVVIWSLSPSTFGGAVASLFSVLLGLYGLEELERNSNFWSLPYAVGYSVMYFVLNSVIFGLWGLLSLVILGYSIYKKVSSKLL